MNEAGKNTIYFNNKLSNFDEIPDNISLIINGNNNIVKLNNFNGKGHLFIEMNCNDSLFSFGADNTINNNVFIHYPIPEGNHLKNV